jgi:hypothetical protein
MGALHEHERVAVRPVQEHEVALLFESGQPARKMKQRRVRDIDFLKALGTNAGHENGQSGNSATKTF